VSNITHQRRSEMKLTQRTANIRGRTGFSVMERVSVTMTIVLSWCCAEARRQELASSSPLQVNLLSSLPFHSRASHASADPAARVDTPADTAWWLTHTHTHKGDIRLPTKHLRPFSGDSARVSPPSTMRSTLPPCTRGEQADTGRGKRGRTSWDASLWWA
jgi:hypothetical protein